MNDPLSALLRGRRTERRALARDPSSPVAALADSLAADLAPWLAAGAPMPMQKARLTRFGGRCPTHGVFLEFDPAQPSQHRCARCQRAYEGREHDDWWAMGAQLWTAERAVHAAALFVLRDDPRHAQFAAHILRDYADRYHTWPNRDNVLGPTRPFFSTYLESIWLLNLCHAVALLESDETTRALSGWSAGDSARIRARLIEPSAMLIASYHEGGSNRQVWNEAAITSAWTLLGRETAVRQRFEANGGVRWQIRHGLDAAGSWYEGENYHLFAHRGLWYGAQLLRVYDEPLTAELDARYSAGFTAPFAGVLPDDTFPSRRDSQYASSIRQWRTAEWCELGWTHTRSPQLAGLLSRLYDDSVPRQDTGRARSTADAERNTAATALTRADLSWRWLLMGDVAPLPASTVTQTSVCLPEQGLAVIRRDRGRTYVALEGGQLGGGHGHPDQLALTLQTGADRWLEDPGTGSYVDPSLFWYRSTLAHAAPQIGGVSQQPVPASMVAFDAQEHAGWMVKRVDGMADGATVVRSIIVCDGYLVDVLEWIADSAVLMELPIAGMAEVIDGDAFGWTDLPPGVTLPESTALFMSEIRSRTVHPSIALRAYPTLADTPSGDGVAEGALSVRAQSARLWYALHSTPDPGPGAPMIVRAEVPGAPWRPRIHRHWLLTYGQTGRIVGVWSWPSAAHPDGVIDSVEFMPSRARQTEMSADVVDAPCVRVRCRNGIVSSHTHRDDGWHIDVATGEAVRSIHLSGFSTTDGPRPSAAEASAPPLMTPSATYDVPLASVDVSGHRSGDPIPGATTIALGEPHYVRTEQSWVEAGAPTADLQLATTATHFLVDVRIHSRHGIVVRELPELNPLDNELDDTNADGLQWYWRSDTSASPDVGRIAAMGLHVPSGARRYCGQGRATSLAMDIMPSVTWRVMPDGWAMRLAWPLDQLPLGSARTLDFELVINERPPERERRRGQLALSGGGGFGYLAGSRRPKDKFVRLRFPAAKP